MVEGTPLQPLTVYSHSALVIVPNLKQDLFNSILPAAAASPVLPESPIIAVNRIHQTSHVVHIAS